MRRGLQANLRAFDGIAPKIKLNNSLDWALKRFENGAFYGIM